LSRKKASQKVVFSLRMDKIRNKEDVEIVFRKSFIHPVTKKRVYAKN